MFRIVYFKRRIFVNQVKYIYCILNEIYSYKYKNIDFGLKGGQFLENILEGYAMWRKGHEAITFC